MYVVIMYKVCMSADEISAGLESIHLLFIPVPILFQRYFFLFFLSFLDCFF